MNTRRALEGELAVVAGFADPTAALEQYPTPADVAAHVVHLADLRGDLDGRTVVDLGAGTGMFALGAALRGADRVVGVELDAGALAVARDNERRVGARTAVHWVNADATRPPLTRDRLVAVGDGERGGDGGDSDAGGDTDTGGDGAVTAIMNPPFGAQTGNEHADRAFLATVADLADVSYSVHNAGSREFVESFAADEGGAVTDAFAATLTLDRTYGHQTNESADVDAEVFRIEWSRASDD
ncbi:METTL5 family protein [Halobaculum sp. CBA1158]|uniref:METTL5 family protein n=1 Tax=Halobaculum sp. CBA1158 TaxID=2904243 RepID=UPI001F36907F|nr:METTL5 family protein [Halobaculum sp. CBA1158]UIO99251.1 METTL5 family protein [Halobaculum sp. CBA1158]